MISQETIVAVVRLHAMQPLHFENRQQAKREEANRAVLTLGQSIPSFFDGCNGGFSFWQLGRAPMKRFLSAIMATAMTTGVVHAGVTESDLSNDQSMTNQIDGNWKYSKLKFYYP